MQIRLNGKSQNFESETVLNLLGEAGMHADQTGIAVAVNAAVVPRGEWEATTLKDGDRVDIIHAVQGG